MEHRADRPAQEPDPSSPPWALRDYAVIADGERGAVVDPRGGIVWLCAPRWHDDAVFSALIGGPGHFTVGPVDPWHVWGGSYEEGTLIRVSRWVTPDCVVECREALAVPARTDRLVLLRRMRAVRGESRLRLVLDVGGGGGPGPAPPPPTGPPRLDDDEARRCLDLLERAAGAHRYVVASGSLPG
ncbi:trehalase-like domain-containing protein, partial [Streptomyces sp. NPDC127100]|uniref:trehalase-like domain-containing protein n=1 Tax=Streptomyces sp. NPDC127100 TaxID=3347138 RepID=UPI00365AD281